MTGAVPHPHAKGFQMNLRFRALTGGVVCTVAGALAVTSAVSSPAAPKHRAPAGKSGRAAAGQPGPLNALTDVPGIQVGQVQKTRPPYLTGSTVVRTPGEPVAGVDERGGSPGTWMTDILSPLNANPGVDALVLTGGSAWGMDVATGAMRWLEDHGTEGVPIVPGAAIYDLGVGGDERARPTASWGYRATARARGGPVRQGNAGAGTGATSSGTDTVLKGGVGTASVELGDGLVVGALVVVNSLGSTVNPKDCTLLGASLGIGGEFAGLRKPSRAECHPGSGDGQSRRTNAGKKDRQAGRHTTIAVVGTNASMQNAAITKVAGVGNDGLARAINPSHTLSDGDTVFAVATGKGPELANNDPDDELLLTRIQAAAADSLSRAVAHAMLSATSVRGFKSYCDTYPSACEDLRRSAHAT